MPTYPVVQESTVQRSLRRVSYDLQSCLVNGMVYGIGFTTYNLYITCITNDDLLGGFVPVSSQFSSRGSAQVARCAEVFQPELLSTGAVVRANRIQGLESELDV